MAEQMPDRPSREHPVVAGLLALAGVGLAIGLLVGLIVIVGTHVLGIGGSSEAEDSGGAASMYLPTPKSTSASKGPRITLAPTGDESESDGASGSASGEPSGTPTASESAKKQITLSASTTSAGQMESFDLTGIYPGGEGAILSVQRFEGGHWADFPATGSVKGETFQIPVQTSQTGTNRFRVVDTEAHLKSAEVRIQIG